MTRNCKAIARNWPYKLIFFYIIRSTYNFLLSIKCLVGLLSYCTQEASLSVVDGCMFSKMGVTDSPKDMARSHTCSHSHMHPWGCTGDSTVCTGKLFVFFTSSFFRGDGGVKY